MTSEAILTESKDSAWAYESTEPRYEYMAWAVPQYSKSVVDKAALALMEDDLFQWNDALLKVNNWRSAHNYPLNIFQDGLRKRARQINTHCLVAQRIKRLSSITAKIERFPTMRLSMMQDIGGCRAVLNSIAEVRKLVTSYKKSDIKHKLHHEDDYIKNPQKSGYRSIHLIYTYFSDKKQTYNGLKIEVQLRSARQHAWATAVETVGTFIQQALKSSQGEKEWLRFFALMGTAIAKMEHCNPVPNTPSDDAELKAEINQYINVLDVENHLHSYGAALKEIEKSETDDHYFLLVLDPTAKEIQISGYRREHLEKASLDYLEIEKTIKGSTKDAVLVSVDSVNTLRRAYPNYFLDTNMFIELVKKAKA